MSCTSKIKSFYQNQVVFLTGATGFVGKLILEKLLRDCDVSKVYILARAKKGKSSEQRFEDLFSLECFRLIRNRDVLQKVVLVTGDCAQPELGLDPEMKEILEREVTCVIHGAANVKFNQTLKEASLYIRAAMDLTELAKRMTHLQSFVFVSTAFSHCVFNEIKEDFYDPPIKAADFLKIAKYVDEELQNELTPKFLGKYPNTYIFSKSIIEDFFKSVQNELPLSIVRPSIIGSSLQEPMPGWVDNIYGINGVVVGILTGILRTFHAEPDVKANLVPVDYVSNCILAAAWKRTQLDKTAIYNYVSFGPNAPTWEKVMRLTVASAREVPLNKCIRYPNLKIRRKVANEIASFFQHTLFGYFADFILFCVGQKPILSKIYKKVSESKELFEYFSCNEWDFKIDNVLSLWEDMNEEDRKIFRFDMRSVDWASGTRNAVYGIKYYFLKEKPEDTSKAQRRKVILLGFHYLSQALYWFLLYKILEFFAYLLNLF